MREITIVLFALVGFPAESALESCWCVRGDSAAVMLAVGLS